MKIHANSCNRALVCLNTIAALGMCAALAMPLASDWISRQSPTQASQRITATSGFVDFSSLMSGLKVLISFFSNELQPFIEAPVAALEKASAGEKELVQALLNYKAGQEALNVIHQAQDIFGSDMSSACSVMTSTAQTVDAKSHETLMARALSAANTRRGMYTSSSSAEMRKLLAASQGDYCSPDSKERGGCSGEISPKSMPDADIHAKTILSSEYLSSTMSQDEFEASSKFVSWATDPVPAETLPIAMERTPAGQRYLVEARRRQAILSSSQFALNRIIASRWEKK